ncbi:bifunctional ligase/repressor BirA [Jeotgalicoccus coquinae]|uniref:Bifunctional ligase/repressor BirA n=1 Tax=Jeotgalicoccus coquinae TaxID=709509 RepID=A0A6V7R987_9STAP|nr:biotin--[acetyl-CoA-carboxylase] ligase [Jeotgalicoccus coquinae]MBB6422958.1 BirA family biotin operon repressor/biotin-[acetyl-CoA-carboxylase] ligase [Jeotgalicoccus coquinae]GGE11806.1 bifunctional ligase/repressor BirA [Jeotgalicoccus coquinae]CAD2073574.1 Bifunctional ligase/repressor BirA [Jeotgalicoccus coquinae]
MSKTKTEILSLLMEGNYLSGAKLAEMLGVSRTAVWKNIQRLKEDGYNIEAVTNKGYRLVEPSGRINESLLAGTVQHSQLFDDLIYKDTIDSTQNHAFRILDQYDGNIVIVSGHQTDGRGRFKREWLSPEETGLYMSLVLRPNITNQEMIVFNLFMSLAISDAIRESTGLKSGIKWPNDIFINDKKVCGFLTEVISADNIVETIVCGIGLNINPSADTESLGTATSITGELDEEFDVNQFTGVLFRKIEYYYDKFLNTSFSSIKEDWLEQAIIFNRELTITTVKEKLRGKALDITDEGYLVILDRDHNIHKVISADIEI